MLIKEKFALYLDLIRWDRPAGWMPLLWPSLSALWLAAQGFPGVHLFLIFIVGTVLMRSSGCCVNDVMDADFDKYVKRTANRPVTTGKISSKVALMVGAVLAFIAFLLVLTTNVYTVGASVVGLLITLIYPRAKRVISMPQAVLGVAFSFGIPMAYLAVRGGGEGWYQAMLPAQAWWLLIGNWFWILAYDTVYAMVDRDDDLKVGIKTSAITLGKWDLIGVFLFNCAYLVIWGVILFEQFGVAWPWLSALCINVVLVFWHSFLIRHRSRENCFRSFSTSHRIGLVFWLGIVLQFAVSH